ncbi:MAG: hypothetical protein IKD15_03145 [Clostridia bacterium]|nr:hypothetical protein [Clostridia bacterium]
MKIHTKTIYVMLSKSDTLTAKILYRITKAPYNHVSISLEEDLSVSYSFARRWKYYPWIGGFIRETPYTGVFGRFPKTEIVAIPFHVTEAQYEGIQARLASMYVKRKRYHYDWIGVFLVLFRKKWRRKYHYFCSDFVKDLLVDFEVIKEGDLPYIVRPNDFLIAYGKDKIYEGELRNFTPLQIENKEQEQTA